MLFRSGRQNYLELQITYHLIHSVSLIVPERMLIFHAVQSVDRLAGMMHNSGSSTLPKRPVITPVESGAGRDDASIVTCSAATMHGDCV